MNAIIGRIDRAGTALFVVLTAALAVVEGPTIIGYARGEDVDPKDWLILLLVGVGACGLMVGRVVNAARTGPAWSRQRPAGSGWGGATALVSLEADIAAAGGIERWLRTPAGGHVTEVASCPDPGNNGPDGAPRVLRLYDVDRDMYGPVRLLVATNGSPEAAGHHTRKHVLVPAAISDPLEAAAGSYGVPVDVYRQLQHRT